MYNERTISRIKIVDISVAKGAASYCVTTNTNARTMKGTELDCISACVDNAYLATGPIMLNISNNMASVTVGSSSPT